MPSGAIIHKRNRSVVAEVQLNRGPHPSLLPLVFAGAFGQLRPPQTLRRLGQNGARVPPSKHIRLDLLVEEAAVNHGLAPFPPPGVELVEAAQVEVVEHAHYGVGLLDFLGEEALAEGAERVLRQHDGHGGQRELLWSSNR
eukprot:1085975-Prorocentrum_minimum.AAC.2